MSRPDDLVDFDSPPIDEVVIGIKYVASSTFTSEKVASYWQSIRESFPNVQYQPRLETPLEQLNSVNAPQQTLGIPFLGMTQNQLGRTWLMSADDSTVIQIQNDQFLQNWRHRGSPYPHFESLCDSYWDWFTKYRTEISADTVSTIHAQQIEVTYINWIEDTGSSLGSWFRPAAASQLAFEELSVESEPLQFWVGSYLIKLEDVPIARLHAQCQGGGFRMGTSGPTKGAQLNLTYRAPIPPVHDDEQLKRMMLDGRNAIVRAFDQLTTDEGKDSWGVVTR